MTVKTIKESAFAHFVSNPSYQPTSCCGSLSSSDRFLSVCFHHWKIVSTRPGAHESPGGMWREKVTRRLPELLQMHLRAPHCGQRAPLMAATLFSIMHLRNLHGYSGQKKKHWKNRCLSFMCWLHDDWLVPLGALNAISWREEKPSSIFIPPPPPLIYIHAFIHIHLWIHRAD